MHPLLAAVVVLCVAHGSCAQQDVRLERIAKHTADDGVTMAAAFAPNGRALAMGGERGDLLVLELPARRQRWMQTPSDHWIGTLAFSPDGSILACCGRDLTLHEVATGRELERWPDTGPYAFAWRADGARYAFPRGNQVVVVDAGKREELASFAFEYPVHALAFAADDTLYAGDNVGRLWRMAPGAREPELVRDHRSKQDDMTRSIAVACAGGVVFDLASLGPLRRGGATFDVVGHPFAFAACPDGRSFAVGGDATRVQWWCEDGAKSRELPTPGSIAALAFHPAGHTLFVSTYTGQQALHGDDGTVVELPSHAAKLHDCAMSPDGTTLAIRGTGWTVRPVLGGAPRRLPGALDVRAGRRGNELLVQYGRRLVLLDGRTGVELEAVDAGALGFGHCSVAGPGNLLLGGGELIDPTTKARTKLPDDFGIATCCNTARSRDGAWALGTVGGIEGDLGSLLVTDERGSTRFSENGRPVFAVAFTPDGRRLFYTTGIGLSFGMGPTDPRLRVRTVGDFALEQDIPVNMSCWRFLDAHRALACVNQELQLWDVDALRAIRTLPIDGPCYGFQLSDDGRTLLLCTLHEANVYRVLRD
jgi:hypothetical protein